MKRVIQAVCAALVVLAPTGALAAQVTYNISGAFVAPATGSYSGSYVYDTTAGTVTSTTIQVSSGLGNDGSAVPANTYIYAGYQAAAFLTYATAIPAAGNRGGFLDMSPSLSAPVSVQFTDGVCQVNDCIGITLSGIRVASTGTVTLAPAPAPVPTMSEWAMIAMGLMLAGGAALVMQRRRLTA